jgi:hypothetical protein
MPYKSLAQVRKFFAIEREGEIKKGTADKWAKHTPNIKGLPKKVKKTKGRSNSKFVHNKKKIYG